MSVIMSELLPKTAVPHKIGVLSAIPHLNVVPSQGFGRTADLGQRRCRSYLTSARMYKRCLCSIGHTSRILDISEAVYRNNIFSSIIRTRHPVCRLTSIPPQMHPTTALQISEASFDHQLYLRTLTFRRWKVL